MADQANLDLVEISPQAEPPVCKVMDYGKFRFEQQKKAQVARKKQKKHAEMIERLKFDILYLENMSLAMDLKIMIYTVMIVVLGRGK